MSYQTTKMAGDLWASLVYVTNENDKIEGFSSLCDLILAEAELKLHEMKPDSEKYDELKQDVMRLRMIADTNEISLKRDMTVAAVNYSYIMTEIHKKHQELLKLGLKHKLIEFSDGARFAGYGEGL